MSSQVKNNTSTVLLVFHDTQKLPENEQDLNESTTDTNPPERGTIEYREHGIRWMFNGKVWKQLCSRVGCNKQSNDSGHCPLHTNEDQRQSSSRTDRSHTPESVSHSQSFIHKRSISDISENNDSIDDTIDDNTVETIVEDSVTESNHLMETSAGLPKKGTIVTTEDGVKKRFNGKLWRRLCGKQGCDRQYFKSGLCVKHIKKSIHYQKSSSLCNRRLILNPKVQRQSLSHRKHVPEISSLIEGHDSEQTRVGLPEIGTIAYTADGIKKRFNGKMWRRLCSRKGCDRQYFKSGVCAKHTKENSYYPKNSSGSERPKILAPEVQSQSLSHRKISPKKSSPKKSSIVVNDVLEELREENERLLKELLFANKCLIVLTEFKRTVDLIFDKIEFDLEKNDWNRYEKSKNETEDCLSGINTSARHHSAVKTRDNGKENRDLFEETIDLPHFETQNQDSSSVKDFQQTTDGLPKKGTIVYESKGVVKRFDGNTWRRVCTRKGCDKNGRKDGLCSRHFKDSIEEQSCDTMSSAAEEHHSEETDVDHPKKGTIMYFDGVKKRFNGKVWRRLCRRKGCKRQSSTALLCAKHYTQKCKSEDSIHSDDEIEKALTANRTVTYVCAFEGCGQRFPYKAGLINHKKKHSKDTQRRGKRGIKFHVCSHEGCDYRCVLKLSLDEHMKRVHIEGEPKVDNPLTQTSQQKRFNYKTDCQSYQSLRYKNHNIGKSLTEEERKLIDEWTRSDDTFKYICQLNDCGYKTDIKNLIIRHINCHKGIKRFVCTVDGCDRRWSNCTNLKLHLLNVHRINDERTRFRRIRRDSDEGVHKSSTIDENDTNVLTRVANRDGRFSCQWEGCHYRVSSRYEMTKHMNRHKGIKPYACSAEGCGHRFFDSWKRRLHEQRFHNIFREKRPEKIPISNTYDFKCEFCDFAHNNGMKFIDHVSGHEEGLQISSITEVIDGKTKYRCNWPGCDFKTEMRGRIPGHVKSLHTNVKDIPCIADGCDQMFHFNSLMTEHHRYVHLGQGIPCDWPGCDHLASAPSQLKRHIVIYHTNERNYSCDWPECGLKFKLKGNLNKHMKYHKSERPYKCCWPGCEADFRWPDSLKKHKMTHTNDKPKHNRIN